MLTSPKVRDPFQVVRMTPRSIGTPHSARFRRSCTARPSTLAFVETRAHDRHGSGATPWRASRAGPAYLVQHDDHWHEVTWDEAAERVENMANGLLARGVRKGECLRDARPHDARMGPVRLRARPGRRRRSRPSTPTARRGTPRTSSTTRSRSASSARTTRRRRRWRASARSLPRLRHCSRSPISRRSRPRARSSRPSIRPRSTTRWRPSTRTTSSRFIYTSGTTGPPKGCMISHRNYYAMVVGDRPPAGATCGTTI